MDEESRMQYVQKPFFLNAFIVSAKINCFNQEGGFWKPVANEDSSYVVSWKLFYFSVVFMQNTVTELHILFGQWICHFRS